MKDLIAALEESVVAAKRARVERDRDHPWRADGDRQVRQACPDGYCRVCKDQDGEVRDGYWL